MRKLLIVFAALAAVAIAVPLSIGSSHREAPNISLDPSADNTDTYAWTAKDAPGSLTVAANWIPGQVPANGPNFFGLDDGRGTTSTSTTPVTAGPTSATGTSSRPRSATRSRSCTRCPGRERVRRPAERDPALLDRPRDVPLSRREGV